MSRGAYLTPDTPDGDPIGRILYIPNTLVPAVNGALSELTYPFNWEQYGDMTPADAAQAAQDMLDAYYSSEIPMTISPTQIVIPLAHRFTDTGLIWNSDANENGAGYWTYSPAAINTKTTWRIRVMPGEYFLSMGYQSANSMGIVTAQIDGVDVATRDMYSASLTRNNLGSISPPFDISDSEYHELTLIMKSKNASSSNYQARYTSMILTRNEP